MFYRCNGVIEREDNVSGYIELIKLDEIEEDDQREEGKIV